MFGGNNLLRNDIHVANSRPHQLPGGRVRCSKPLILHNQSKLIELLETYQ